MSAEIIRWCTEFVAQDFRDFPVWILVPPDEMDDLWGFFRPWDGPIPFDELDPFMDQAFYARADFTAADGSRFEGYVSLNSRGASDPTLFLNERDAVDFNFGVDRPTWEQIQEIYIAFRKTPAQLFPIRVMVSEKYAGRDSRGTIVGFSYSSALGGVIVFSGRFDN